MPETKHFIVIGLGTFGAALAQRLTDLGCRVTGVDSVEEHVEALKNKLYEAIIGDATDRDTLQHAPIRDAEAVFIGLGEDIARSLLATLHVKELGAKRIVVKGVTLEHGRILKALGVERVVYPEIEIARAIAEQFALPNLVGSVINLGPDYAMVEVSVPEGLRGKTLQEADLRRRCRINVVAVRNIIEQTFVLPEADFRFGPDQAMLVVGRLDDIQRLKRLE